MLSVAPASAQYATFRALDPAAELEMLADGAFLITPSSSFLRPGTGTVHTNFRLFPRPDCRPLAACRTEVYSMIANDSFVGANVHRTRDRAQSALLRSPIELASRCLGCI